MKQRLTVITLGVQDLERARRFYRDGLGLPTEGIIGTEFEYGAVAFFELQAGLRLAICPIPSIAHDTGLPAGAPSPTACTLGHNVASRAQVDAVMEHARNAGATIVKPGDVYGPASQPWAVVPFEMLKGRRFALPMKGRGLLTLVYIDDLVDCVYRALTMPEGEGGVFTAWDGHAVTAKEFFDHYARMLGRKGVPTAPTTLLRPVLRLIPGVDPDDLQFLMRHAVFPNARAREVLGWEPKVDLAEGMRRTEAWLREEGMLA